MASSWKPTPWQEELLAIPVEHDVLALAGRGTGKTVGGLLLCLSQVARLEKHARILYTRRTRTSLKDAWLQALELFQAADPGASFNVVAGEVRFSNGAVVWFGELSDPASLQKWTGINLSMLVCDEVEQHPVPLLIDRLTASLRGREGRLVLLGHGGDVGDSWLLRRYLAKSAEPGVPFQCEATGRSTVRLKGDHSENPHLPANYADTIRAAATGDPYLAQAWLTGDLAIASGAFFQGLDLEAATIPAWPGPIDSWWWATAGEYGWKFRFGIDWGTASPAAAIFLAEAPGDELGPDGRRYVAGSLVAFSEVHTARADDPSKGRGLAAFEFAGELREEFETWGLDRLTGVCDPSMAASTGHPSSIIGEFKAAGVTLDPASKLPRPEGWSRIRSLLAGAAAGDRPALYVTTGCPYLLEALQVIPRRPGKPDDLDTSHHLDHPLDALRYGLSARGSAAGTMSWAEAFRRAKANS